MLHQDVQPVYEQLRTEIIEGGYTEGQSLREIPLAEKYGVKRARIRQIFRELEHDSLVEIIPGKGAFVKSITAKDLSDIFEMRIALEGMAARLAARRRDDEGLEKAIAVLEQCRESSPEYSQEQKVKVGEQIHDFILSSSGNDLILHALEPLKMQVRRIWRGSYVIPGRIDKAFEEHREILKALKNRDEDLAASSMRDHLSNAFEEYVREILSK